LAGEIDNSMGENNDSIYPEFFKTGLGKLRDQARLSEEFHALFTSLQYFHRDIKEPAETAGIISVAQRYLDGLDLFQLGGFYLVNPSDFGFELVHCAPAERAEEVETIVKTGKKDGKFAYALRQSEPVFFNLKAGGNAWRGLFHPLRVASHTIGMFCGVLRKERLLGHEIAFRLLSVLLSTTADALAEARNTADLKNKILVANQDLQRALRENEVLARIPAESPSPVIRLSKQGQVLYSNRPGLALLQAMRCQVGDMISGDWLQTLREVFQDGEKREFEITCQERDFTFLAVAVAEAGYANFYGTDITARKQAEQERQRTIVELQDALQKVKTLSGLLPICASCKKIRDDKGYWNHVESYIEHHSQAIFSHGICPDCVRKLYPDLADSIEASMRKPQGPAKSQAPTKPQTKSKPKT
jgi:PAS domain-containing protein